ncbi:MAG: transglycosylase domain-containing protein [Thermodesulfobacteriota bacterium]|nr:transglycosylase domain-containing protein [Thermodesulfobacteriota bacterium]
MKIIKIFAWGILIFFIVSLSVGFFYYRSAWIPALEMTKRENIEKIISAESPVYYENEKDIIGVFFQEEHRRYLKFQEIPEDFIKAIIAAEDHSFFKHHGFDLKAILRALFVNIKSWRIVQGGSTITQQTAKNIFKRQKRSFGSKIKELIHALLLESYYTKEEILEFYSNQFFVNGNGRGIGVASEYFFDKPVNQLNLVECAFIAGAVKGPNRYNVFTKRTPETKERTLQSAKQRIDYVLKNMYGLGMISTDEYEVAKNQPIPFKEGRIGYQLNVILDYVRDQLQGGSFQKTLLEQGIDNIATSGIKIYTTIDKEIQESAYFTLKKHLSYLETKLNGYVRKLVQERYANLIKESLESSEIHQTHFAFGKVQKVVRKGGSSFIDVDLQGVTGRIGYSGMLRLGNAWKKSRVGEWGKFDKRDVNKFLREFRPGDMIYVSTKDSNPDSEKVALELEQRPEIEGGIIALRKGEIKAMVGGFKNEFFNRAVDAKRQLGSIFKPIVYTAALQLGWNNLDTLDNSQSTFQFQDTVYSPRPDHESPFSQVSMAWAGIKSENLATIWLLYHLCDRLDMSQFRQIAEKVGLTQKKDENYNQYRVRIRDRNGIVINKEALMEAVFDKAKTEVITDLIFDGEEEEIEGLKHSTFEEFSDGSIHRRLSLNTIEKLATNIRKHYEDMSRINLYDFRILLKIREFRVLVGLKYVVKLAKKMGISSQLDDVLSFPLGSNSISILDACMAYQTILSGKVFTNSGNEYTDFIPIIKKIVDRNGETIYEYEPKVVNILDSRVSNMVIPILRGAVKHGTGRSAEGRIVLRIEDFQNPDIPYGVSFKIPAYGKTGTSNDFTNSSFCGFIPGPLDGEMGLSIKNSYVIATYVGYDNNKPLKNKHIKVYGSSGALPIWIEISNKIIQTENYSEHIDPVDLVFQGVDELSLVKEPDVISVAIDSLTSLPLNTDSKERSAEEIIEITSYGKMNQGSFLPERFFLPFPQN